MCFHFSDYSVIRLSRKGDGALLVCESFLPNSQQALEEGNSPHIPISSKTSAMRVLLSSALDLNHFVKKV